MNVHTWADAFGNWHARVTLDDDMPPSSAMIIARRAIRRELSLRNTIGAGYRLKLDGTTDLDGRTIHAWEID